jgi:hypothetical protein
MNQEEQRPSAILLYVMIGFLSLISPVCAKEGQPRGDYLMTIDPEYGISLGYRKIYECKLFVTRGTFARYLFLPGGRGTERSAAIHRATRETNGFPGGYWVTSTIASDRLWDCVPGTERPIGAVGAIRVSRADAPLPESTALAVRKAWLACIATARTPPENELRGDSSSQIFSVTQPSGAVLRAETHDFGQKNVRLLKLGEKLIGYCSVPAPLRVAAAREIEEEAMALLKIKNREYSGPTGRR